MRDDVADITLRSSGAHVSARTRVPIRFAYPRRRGVFLIHGYNVNEKEAIAALGGFRNALAYYAPALGPDIFVCTWAGNWNIVGLRPAAYPFMLRNARESAETLVEGISEWYRAPSAPEELVIVAHSLGCRLTVEMLSRMWRQGRPANLRRLVVVLMAAAIPVEHVASGGALEDARRVADTVIVLYSEWDRVLSRVFGLGQTVAGDGWFPEAVGLHGNPQQNAWTQREQMRQFDHGDYWGELETAELICQALGMPIRPSARAVPLHSRKALDQHYGALRSFLPGSLT